MTFGNGQQQFEVRWMPGGDEAAQRNDKYGVDSHEHFEATVAGAHADVYRYDSSSTPRAGGRRRQQRRGHGQAPSNAAFLDAARRASRRSTSTRG